LGALAVPANSDSVQFGDAHEEYLGRGGAPPDRCRAAPTAEHLREADPRRQRPVLGDRIRSAGLRRRAGHLTAPGTPTWPPRLARLLSDLAGHRVSLSATRQDFRQLLLMRHGGETRHRHGRHGKPRRGARPALSSGVMWYPPDPDEPTSELYRLTPPRRRSELREALDAAAGVSREDTAALAVPVLQGAPASRKGIASFFGGVISNALGAILATIAVALSLYLWAHFFHPAGHPPVRPAATATAHR
jgi:hypothetical protein